MPAFRKPWTTPGGTRATIPAGTTTAPILDPEPDGQLAGEHVEQVGVVQVDVQVGAFATRAEARPRRVERLVVGEDLDLAALGRVADHLAAAERNEQSLAHDYLTILTARARTSRTVSPAVIDSASMSSFARRLKGIASVGENAIEFVAET